MPPEIAFAQLISYVSLTFGSLTVATVSLIFAFRQSFGWRPIVVITSHGFRGGGDLKDDYALTLNLEFWNRRTYPLVMRGIKLSFTDMKFSALRTLDDPDSWSLQESAAFYRPSGSAIAAREHRTINFAAPFSKRSLDQIRCDVLVEVTYFDPRNNKTKTIIAKHIWAFS